MRPSTRWVCLAVGVLVVLGCRARPAELTTEDQTVLRGMFDTTASSFRTGDFAPWAGQFSEDASLQPPNAPTVNGRGKILAWGQAFPPVEDLSFTNVQVWGEGNMAYGTSGYVLKVKGAPPDTGKQLAVFRRQAGGKWEVTAGCFSSDLPIPGQQSRPSARQ
jgi:ketosteroid isomerase-like protein